MVQSYIVYRHCLSTKTVFSWNAGLRCRLRDRRIHLIFDGDRHIGRRH
jgi:hypothetical protein